MFLNISNNKKFTGGKKICSFVKDMTDNNNILLTEKSAKRKKSSCVERECSHLLLTEKSEETPRCDLSSHPAVITQPGE